MANVGVYIPPALQERIQRLKEKGVELPVSAICQRALQIAVEAEERALEGDRLDRLLLRLQSTRSVPEQLQAEGTAAGRNWAEEIASLSELKRLRAVLDSVNKNGLLATQIRFEPDGAWIDFVYRSDADKVLRWPESASVPGNVPREFFNRAGKPRDGTVHLDAAVIGFLRGANEVLERVEEALRKRDEEEAWRRNRDDPDRGGDRPG